ncbi:site-specific integrase [Cyclobacterium jeungdonense]|uniref:Phage integrase SAM-like domain-containing protein n=1 Tax=Cyclobacterium jeungdonense TaxID=708087 RepID=A0ABT8CA20_9BACT|nr:site-specific integrase [Cyclobacterium jeungdonense]MDN3689650.1 phage integrase SAM-like domain-containing protein [Cyclobacterium jeungdonense]
MAKFNFYLRDKSREGETPVILFISYNGWRLKYATGKIIHPKFWNENDQLTRQVKEFPTAKIFNNRLKYIKGEAEKILGELENTLGHPPSMKELKENLDRVLKLVPEEDPESPDYKPSFLNLFDRFIKEAESGARLTASGKKYDLRTIQKYKTTYKKLQSFGRKYNLSFESIDHNFYSKFVQEMNKKGYRINSVGKHIMVIKTFMSYATENGYNTNLFFKSKKFKAYNVTGFSVYLNESELQAIYEKDLSKTPHLDRVRDLFLVGAWTGLRFSDFTSIKPGNIKKGFLHIKTAKTGENVVIPIHHTIKAIMAKHQGKYPNNLPPAISNQKMNKYLKDIAQEIDCLQTDVEAEYIQGGMKVTETKKKWELVTTHTARRSFATNVYKSGFPAISLMKITGHRTETAFLKYIKVTPEDVASKLMEHWNENTLKVG